MKKKKIAMILAATMLSNIAIPVLAAPTTEEISINIEDGEEVENISDMRYFTLRAHPNFEEYQEVFKVQRDSIINVSTNGGHHASSVAERAIDGSITTHWETKTKNSDTFKNEFTVEFEEVETIDKISYKIRSTTTGFMNEYEIYASDSSDGDDFELIAEGKGDTTLDFVEINFEPTEAKRIKIVFVEAHNSWASISEVEYYRHDEVKEKVESIFNDNLYTELSEEYNTIEKLEILESEILNHPFEEDFKSTISLAKDMINGTEVQRSEIYTLSQRGDENADKARIRKRYAGGNLDLTGYYVMPGESIEIYLDADASDILPQVVFAQVGEAEIDDNFRINLEPGKNIVTAPVNYTKPFAVYFANRALPEDQAYAPRAIVKGESLQKYPIYIHGVTDPEAYIEEVTNHTGANMTDLIGEEFLVSARNTEAQIAYVENGHSPLDLAREMENLVDIFNDISGLYEDDENPIHKTSQALYHAKFTNLSGTYAGNEFIHGTFSAARSILAGSVYGWGLLHEYAHQVEGVGLMQSEITTNIYSIAVSQKMGVDLSARFDHRDVVLDNYLINNESAGYTSFSYHEKVLFIYRIINYFGIDIYTEAFRTIREDWSVYPSSVAVQALVASFSEKTGYDLAPYFDLYKYPLTEETREYTSQFKPLDLKLQYTSLDAYDMINDNVETFDSETKAVIENIEKYQDGIELTIGTDDNNEGAVTYEIYRNGELIAINRTGTYKDMVDTTDLSKSYTYEVVAYDYRLNESIKSDEVTINIEAIPMLEVEEGVFIEIGEEFNPLKYVKALNYKYEEIEVSNVELIKNDIDNTKTGTYEVVYKIEDEGYTAVKSMYVEVVANYDYASDMTWKSATTGWAEIKKDTGVRTNNKIKLNIEGEIVEFDKGISVVANSEIVYDIEDIGYDYLTTYVGTDKNYNVAQTSIVASILVDGEEVYNSGFIGRNTEADFIKVSLEGASEVRFIIDDNGNGLAGDFGSWVDTKFVKVENDKHTVSFELNGGTGDFQEQIVEEGELIVVSEEPTREGYVFDGWYLDSNFETAANLEELSLERDITLYAKWAKLHTLSFELNGGEGDFSNQEVIDGESPVVIEEPTREGYVFSGWYADSNFTEKVELNELIIENDITLYAKWEGTYTLSFNLNGGEGDIPSQSIALGGNPIKPEYEPTKAGYIFDGWYIDEALQKPMNFDEWVMEYDGAVFAKWTKIYTLSFNLNGGVGDIPAQAIASGENPTEPQEEPTRAGYVFDGWYVDELLTTKMNFETWTMNNSGTVFARWRTAHTLSFNLNGGEGDFPTQTILMGEHPTRPEGEPTREGYIFAGWYVDSRLTTPMNFETWVMRNSGSVFAKWISSN